MIKNKQGITLMEVIAYIAIIGIVVTLLTNTMILAIKSHDNVKGQGALDTEASIIMSSLINRINSFSPEYIISCLNDDVTYCVELVDKKEWIIDEDGLLKEENVDKRLRIVIDRNNNLYINNYQHNVLLNSLKLNSDNFYVDSLRSQIYYECNIENPEYCQQFTLVVKLSLYKENANGKQSKHSEYLNRLSFSGK
ncbi:MAG TPA: prepilin-type N-terminal cleavage/methylation domain-containing protein [Haloplasmataceae bacterium]